MCGYLVRRVTKGGRVYTYLVWQEERTVRPLTSLEADNVRTFDTDYLQRWAREIDTAVPSTLESGANTIRRVRR